MSEWKKCRLRDYIDINPQENLPKGTIAKKIPMDCIQPYCRDIYNYITTEYKGGTKFRNNDTLMARITPCLENGKTSMVRFLRNNEIAFGSTEFIVFRAKPQLTDPNYVYYLTTSALVREPAIKSMVGSSGRQRVQNDVVENLTIPLPSLPIQRKIASILSALDDKIELNNRMNKNLEEQARTIFEQEFIENEDTPDGWMNGSLLDIADYLNGLAMQKYRPKETENGLPVLKIKELRQGFCDSNSDRCSSTIDKEYTINNGDIVFSWSGSLLVDYWCGGKCGLNQHLFKVTSKKYDKWFIYSWTNYHLSKFAKIASDMATTMGHIKRDELSKAKVKIPSSSDYFRIGSILNPIYNQIIANRLENNKLAILRDTLLPKLMSGELDVSDINL